MSDATPVTTATRKQMNKVYENLHDQHVARIVVYAKTKGAYADEAGTIPFTMAQLKDAFEKGCVIRDTTTTNEYEPLAYDATYGLMYMTFSVDNSSKAVTATGAFATGASVDGE